MPSLLALSGRKNIGWMICLNKVVFPDAHMSVPPRVTGRGYPAETLIILLHTGEKETETKAVKTPPGSCRESRNIIHVAVAG